MGQNGGLRGCRKQGRAGTLTTAARPAPAQAFSVMAIWNMMRISMFFVPFSVKGFSHSRSAVERFQVRARGWRRGPQHGVVFAFSFKMVFAGCGGVSGYGRRLEGAEPPVRPCRGLSRLGADPRERCRARPSGSVRLLAKHERGGACSAVKRGPSGLKTGKP